MIGNVSRRPHIDQELKALKCKKDIQDIPWFIESQIFRHVIINISTKNVDCIPVTRIQWSQKYPILLSWAQNMTKHAFSFIWTQLQRLFVDKLWSIYRCIKSFFLLSWNVMLNIHLYEGIPKTGLLCTGKIDCFGGQNPG